MMSPVKVEPVVNLHALVGEGPVWEESEQTLLFVDIMGKKIHRWNPTTNQITSCSTDAPVGFAVPARGGGYVAGVGRTFSAVDWSTGAVTSLVTVDDDKPQNRLNDGKVDPAGRLFAGTMGLEQSPGEVQRKQGSLFSVDSDLTLIQHLDQVDISNGLDWSSDGKLFFYVDSLKKTLDVFDYDVATGRMDSRRVVFELKDEEGLPDGLTLDADGKIWICCYNGWRVIQVDPHTGVRLQTVALPVSKTTSCCFGGPHYSDLYVTSASLGLSQSDLRVQTFAGATFRISGLGVKGRPPVEFGGNVLKKN
ncbi:regucalcin isoform X2 [Boleophthalmus pectinirostris]|uniref:regucalcin isoform X2 n=1 Tax=Boleophthalmus pectinirostris TaxID=150288 RepID=UPI000A1C1BE1|nr:regucalcin isoform X2 [Boleophthalmus pectinirostris]